MAGLFGLFSAAPSFFKGAFNTQARDASRADARGAR